MTAARTICVGLTGSIGMGKSTVAKHFRKLGFAIFDSDLAVHELYSKGGAAVPVVADHFPDCIEDGAVNRKLLGTRVVGNKEAIALLESLVHPLVSEARQQFYETCKQRGDFLVVFDVPLLFETKASEKVDYTLVVSADAEIQRARVLSRPGMTEERFLAIKAKQMPDSEKRSRANFVVDTGFPGFAQARSQVCRVVDSIMDNHTEWWHTFATKDSIVPTSCEDPAWSKWHQRFDAIVFDLDDTLIPCPQPVRAAIAHIVNMARERHPQFAEDVEQNMAAAIKQLKTEQPLIAHDVTELRTEAMRLIAARHNVEPGFVGELMAEFLRVRSLVDQYAYEDVEPVLAQIKSSGLRMGLLSNGNTDITQSALLSRYFEFYLSAADVGASKPSRLPFVAAAAAAQTRPGRVLYVGDSLNVDVVGARAACTPCVWLDRVDRANSSSAEELEAFPQPDIRITTLHELKAAVDNWLSRTV